MQVADGDLDFRIPCLDILGGRDRDGSQIAIGQGFAADRDLVARAVLLQGWPYSACGLPPLYIC
jgi:hypothetical protein